MCKGANIVTGVHLSWIVCSMHTVCMCTLGWLEITIYCTQGMRVSVHRGSAAISYVTCVCVCLRWDANRFVYTFLWPVSSSLSFSSVFLHYSFFRELFKLCITFQLFLYSHFFTFFFSSFTFLIMFPSYRRNSSKWNIPVKWWKIRHQFSRLSILLLYLYWHHFCPSYRFCDRAISIKY